MSQVFYVLFTFLEACLSVFGIRATYEEPPFRVLSTLEGGVELRAYGPLVAVETTADGDGFGRLFRYIAGANGRRQPIAMTVPVQDRGGPLGGAADDFGGAPVLRFFLPRSVAADPPPPDDLRVRVVHLPARTLAATRFSGRLNHASIAAHAADLEHVLAAARRPTAGPAYVLGYDPPFALPFLRRNEVAVDLASS